MTMTPSTESTATPSRVAIVTGGSGGIGRVAAERLAADGMTVVVAYPGNPDRAAEVVAVIETSGGVASAIAADVADEAAVASLFDQVERWYGGIDVDIETSGGVASAIAADVADAGRGGPRFEPGGRDPRGPLHRRSV
jgi:3-oxoacyl-[acyl-carrier protein] reductase